MSNWNSDGHLAVHLFDFQVNWIIGYYAAFEWNLLEFILEFLVISFSRIILICDR